MPTCGATTLLFLVAQAASALPTRSAHIRHLPMPTERMHAQAAKLQMAEETAASTLQPETKVDAQGFRRSTSAPTPTPTPTQASSSSYATLYAMVMVIAVLAIALFCGIGVWMAYMTKCRKITPVANETGGDTEKGASMTGVGLETCPQKVRALPDKIDPLDQRHWDRKPCAVVLPNAVPCTVEKSNNPAPPHARGMPPKKRRSSEEVAAEELLQIRRRIAAKQNMNARVANMHGVKAKTLETLSESVSPDLVTGGYAWAPEVTLNSLSAMVESKLARKVRREKSRASSRNLSRMTTSRDLATGRNETASVMPMPR
eukprot:TRINITY_DN1215_c0_g1_i12.p1 TRINITY_DN1215_c0_g1~~TRINITY_DN1215_c0_g1_i12.p1  ORF type:complete len:316 (-),score=57.90 TRINITY_DN1215_c0_g1_i12:130-1077(-)